MILCFCLEIQDGILRLPFANQPQLSLLNRKQQLQQNHLLRMIDIVPQSLLLALIQLVIKIARQLLVVSGNGFANLDPPKKIPLAKWGMEL